MGNGIFLSYRRSDSEASARRLYDDLEAAFGAERILCDIEMPASGRDFVDLIDQSLGGCSAVLVLIGPAFLARAQAPDDYVNQEIARALASGLPVMPVLLERARMPALADLPEPLQGLAYRNAIELSTRNWRQDVAGLIDALRRITGEAVRPAGGLLAGLRRMFEPVPAAMPALPHRTAARSAPATLAAPPAPPAAERDIFISYAFEDEPWAQQVVATLEAQGYGCWIASRDIVPGSPSYAREIARAIKSARLLVVVLSTATNGSDDVLNEITLAKNNGVPRLPLRVDAGTMDEGLEYYFSQAQRLESATQDRVELLQRLARAVAQQLGAPRPAG